MTQPTDKRLITEAALAALDLVSHADLEASNGLVEASGDTTGATDTAAINAALAACGYMSGTTRPTSNVLTVMLGPGPYYINPNVLIVRPAQRLVGLSPVSTMIYCVGGTVGQVFINRKDPNFSLSGVDPTSQGGEISNITLDGSKAGAGTVGIQCGDALSSRMDVVVQKFGGNSLATSTTVITATVGGASRPSTGITANSHIVTSTAAAIADIGATVTGANIPAGSYVGGVVAGVSYVMSYASRPALLNCTATGTITAQIGFIRSDASVGTTTGSPTITDATATANDLGSYIYGTGIPVGAVIIGVTPGVSYTIGTASKGVLYKNTTGWYERNDDQVMCFDNAESIVFDQGSPSAFNSNSYCDFRFDLRMKHGQRGISIRNAPTLYGAKFRVTGGVSAVASPANNGIVWHAHLAGGMALIGLDMEMEAGGGNNTYTGAVPIHLADSGTSLNGSGVIAFYCSASNAPWQSAKRVTGSLSAATTGLNWSGYMAGIGNASANVFSYGNPTWRSTGLTTPMVGSCGIAGSTITVYYGTGNYFKPQTLTAGTNYTLAFDQAISVGASSVLDYRIVFQQPGSGTPAAITTWPSGVTFTGTTGPTVPISLDSTPGSRTVVHMLSTDGASTWTVWRENEGAYGTFTKVVRGVGIDPTGTADSSTAIQAILDSMDTYLPGRLHFPKGIYKIATGLTSAHMQLEITGEGVSGQDSTVSYGDTQIRYTGSGAAITFNPTGPYGGPRMSGIHLLGTAAATAGIVLGHAHNWVFRDVSISDFTGASAWGFVSSTGVGVNQYGVLDNVNINLCTNGADINTNNGVKILGGSWVASGGAGGGVPIAGTVGLQIRGGSDTTRLFGTNIASFARLVDVQSGINNEFHGLRGENWAAAGSALRINGTNTMMFGGSLNNSLSGNTGVAIEVGSSAVNTYLRPGAINLSTSALPLTDAGTGTDADWPGSAGHGRLAPPPSGGDDLANLQACVNGIGTGTVTLRAGTYLLSNTLTIPNKVILTGQGRSTTSIKAHSSFPTTTALVALGPTGLSFSSRLMKCSVDCNNVAGSVGVYSYQGQEMCTVEQVTVSNFKDTGIHMDTGSADFGIKDVECYPSSTGANYGIHLHNAGSQVITSATVGVSGALTVGIYVEGGEATLIGTHVENCTDGILFDSARGSAIGTSGPTVNTNVTNLIRGTGNTRYFTIIDATKGGATNNYRSDFFGKTVTDAYVQMAVVGNAQMMRLQHNGDQAGFYGTTPITKPAVTGNREDNTALTSLLTQLANLGLVTNSTTTGVEMKRWYAALAHRDTAPARVIGLGDSITEGLRLSATISEQRWVDVVQQMVRQHLSTYGVGAKGYMPAIYCDGGMTEETTRGGGATFTEDYWEWGLGGKCIFFPTPGTLAWPAQTCTKIRVHYGISNLVGGAFRVFIDGSDVTNTGRLWRNGADVGAAGTTVTCANGTNYGGGMWWESATLASASHTVQINSENAFNCIIAGAEFMTDDYGKGFHVYDAGHSGASTSDLIRGSMDTTHWQDVQALKPGLILLNIGSNDATLGVSASTYQTNLGTLMDKIHTYAPGAVTVIMKGWRPGGVTQVLWDAYNAARETVAAAKTSSTNPCFTFDLQNFWPVMPDDGSNNLDLMWEAPGVLPPLHPNRAGHRRLSDIFTKLIVGP